MISKLRRNFMVIDTSKIRGWRARLVKMSLSFSDQNVPRISDARTRSDAKTSVKMLPIDPGGCLRNFFSGKFRPERLPNGSVKQRSDEAPDRARGTLFSFASPPAYQNSNDSDNRRQPFLKRAKNVVFIRGERQHKSLTASPDCV